MLIPLLLIFFFTGMLAGLLVAIVMVWPPLDGLIKLFNHTPKG